MHVILSRQNLLMTSAQNGVKNVSDQSGPWIDVFAIYSHRFREKLAIFLDITGLMVSAVICMSLRRV